MEKSPKSVNSTLILYNDNDSAETILQPFNAGFIVVTKASLVKNNLFPSPCNTQEDKSHLMPCNRECRERLQEIISGNNGEAYLNQSNDFCILLPMSNPEDPARFGFDPQKIHKFDNDWHEGRPHREEAVYDEFIGKVASSLFKKPAKQMEKNKQK